VGEIGPGRDVTANEPNRVRSISIREGDLYTAGNVVVGSDTFSLEAE
jgi:hypothetical protein